MREYKFRFEHDPDGEALITTCMLAFEEGRVVYNRVGSRMALQKRPRGAVTRPSRIRIRKRELTEAEEDERLTTRQRLTSADVDGEEADVARDAASASPSLSD